MTTISIDQGNNKGLCIIITDYITCDVKLSSIILIYSNNQFGSQVESVELPYDHLYEFLVNTDLKVTFPFPEDILCYATAIIAEADDLLSSMNLIQNISQS